MKGYFSLVQYAPDVARQEAVNVGVVLLCPDQSFIGVQMAPGNHRVRRFFGEEADHYSHLNAMKDSLAARIQIEGEQLRTLESFRTFVAARGNKIVLTDPKPMRVTDGPRDLCALYEELVLEPRKPLSSQAAKPLRVRLDDALGLNRLRPFLKHDVRVKVTALKREIEAPYGFKNGRFNLIQPITFTQKSADAVARAACVPAVEGHSLFKYPDQELGELQLVIVAEFPNAKAEALPIVQEIFAENHVRLIVPETLGDFAEEIAATGKPLALI